MRVYFVVVACLIVEQLAPLLGELLRRLGLELLLIGLHLLYLGLVLHLLGALLRARQLEEIARVHRLLELFGRLGRTLQRRRVEAILRLGVDRGRYRLLGTRL